MVKLPRFFSGDTKTAVAGSGSNLNTQPAQAPAGANNQLNTSGKTIGELAQSQDVGNLLGNIVREALVHKSSDIHLEPTEGDMRVRYRIDGILQEVLRVPRQLVPALIFKIKIVAKIRTDEHFAPQDGRIRFLLEGSKGHVDVRISILPITKGEKVVMRLLSQEGKSFALEELGIMGKDLEKVQKSYSKPYGMIIASGPTGSGKTTTLYSILKILNSPEINISTIEDPVEYDIEGVNHVQVNPKTELTFAAGLRAMLRQDPNVIMIGEIRDSETARIAINAALTGHLVLTTIHTNDAASTIPRLIDMGIEPYLVASTLNVIISQRLARKLQPDSREKYILSKFEYDNLLVKLRPDIAGMLKIGDEFYRPKDSSNPNASYSGRIGLYEILEVDESIRKIIADGATADDIFRLARKNQGLTTVLEDGINKLREGTITLSELMRVTALKE